MPITLQGLQGQQHSKFSYIVVVTKYSETLQKKVLTAQNYYVVTFTAIRWK